MKKTITAGGIAIVCLTATVALPSVATASPANDSGSISTGSNIQQWEVNWKRVQLGKVSKLPEPVKGKQFVTKVPQIKRGTKLDRAKSSIDGVSLKSFGCKLNKKGHLACTQSPRGKVYLITGDYSTGPSHWDCSKYYYDVCRWKQQKQWTNSSSLKLKKGPNGPELLQYTKKYQRKRCSGLAGDNMTNCDFSEIYFRKSTDLSGKNLANADLSSKYLGHMNLSGANLTGAKLNLTKFYDADLSEADLSGSTMKSVTLSGANLSGANLSYANLSRANFTFANLQGTNLTGATLTGADTDYITWTTETICPNGAPATENFCESLPLKSS